MRSFFKIFLASFLALVVFAVVFFFFTVGYVSSMISSIGSAASVSTGANAVLMLDLSVPYGEKTSPDALAGLSGRLDIPGVFDVIRMIRFAKNRQFGQRNLY